MAGDAHLPRRLSRAAGLVLLLAPTLLACNTDAPWRTRSADASRASPPPAAAAVPDPAPHSDLDAVAAQRTRVAWARLRWPGGDVLDGHDLPRLEEPVLAGSLFKVVVARAALEQGVVTETTRLVCPRRVEVLGRRLDCAHPDLARPLTLEDALAQSCNHFFVRLAERLQRDPLALTLRRLSDGHASPLSDEPLPLVVLGLEGPRQGLRGWLRTVLAALHDEEGQAAHGAVLRRGMARAVSEGTAGALRGSADLVFAKTGTTLTEGVEDGRVVAWRPEIGEALLVRAPGASGRDAARIGSVFWQHAEDDQQPTVRVGRVRTTADPPARPAIEDVPLEAYVAGVVAAEADASMPPAVHEALAVAARSYARAPDGRHARDGYDVCDTTHCQVFGVATGWSVRAADATRGLVLAHDGRVVGVPYSASCGGILVSPRDLWGGTSPVVTAVGAEPTAHAVATWSREVDHARLLAALREAGQQGARLDDVRVERRTDDGVPIRVTLVGLTPGVMPATTFRLVVGRRLGWDVLKSDSWQVDRTAGGFRFSGRGKGHGAGLCLAGAAQMAGGGASALRILGAYAPRARVWSERDALVMRLPSGLASQASALRVEARSTLATLRLKLAVTSHREIAVHVHPTAEAYQRATGRAWWTGASTRWLGGTSYRIDMAPPAGLRATATLMHTLAHELAHVLTASTLEDAPAWAAEGLSAVAIRSGLVEQAGGSGPCPTGAEIRRPGSRDAMRTAYARAEACVMQALPDGLKSWRALAY